ncbi:MAG TPA: hypothetical protein VK206_15310 [Anaerolineales bacterium]|nr:hypothetical protein [Anaerolineales bacterium]HLO27494.1 hypothetical protein [Anaerolineales bacterium]
MATNDVRKSQLLSAVAIVSIFGLAYWLDIVAVSWRRQARAEFNMQPFLLFYVMLPLAFVILAVFLSWLLLTHFKSTWVTLFLCLLIGINFVVFAASMVFRNPILLQIVNSTGFALVNRGVFAIGNGSMTLQMEALLLVIGVINLIRTVRSSMPKSR